MNPTTLIARFKVRQFLGPLRAPRTKAILLLLYVFVFLPESFFLGLFVNQTPLWTDPPETLALVATMLWGLAALSSLTGGTMTHPAEVDFFFTAPVRPQSIFRAELLFQAVLYGGSSFALIFPAVAGLWIAFRLSALAVATLVAWVVAFEALAVLTLTTLGLLRLTRPRVGRALAAGLFLSLLLPGVARLASVPVRYSTLPLPSAWIVRAGLHALGEPPATLEAIFAVVALGVLAAAHARLSRENVLSAVKPSPILAFGQMGFEARAWQQRKLMEFFARRTSGVVLRADRGSPTGYMWRFHLVRFVRDGSVFFLAAFLVPFLLLGTATSGPTTGAALAVTSVSFFLGLLAITVLGSNWVAIERDNLWVLVASAGDLVTYFLGLFLGLATVALVPPAVALAFLLATNAANLVSLAPLSFVAGASAAQVVVLAKIRIPKSSFSLASFLLFLAPGLGGAAAAVPVVLGDAFVFAAGPLPIRLTFEAACALVAGAIGSIAVRAAARAFRLE